MGKSRLRAKARTKAKAKAHNANDNQRRLAPTGELLKTGEFVSAGLAYRRTPVIDTLLKAGKITEREHAALGFYRDVASQSEDDRAGESVMAPSRMMGCGKSSTPNDIPKGYSNSPATIETARIERDLGSLQPLARAIAVDDMTLTQWAIGQCGGRLKTDQAGRTVAIVPRMNKGVTCALVELKFAASRIIR